LNVRRGAPRSFGYAQDDRVGICALRRMRRWVSDNIKVGVFACAKDFSATLEMTEGGKCFECAARGA
jgi:hypothetical protein